MSRGRGERRPICRRKPRTRSPYSEVQTTSGAFRLPTIFYVTHRKAKGELGWGGDGLKPLVSSSSCSCFLVSPLEHRPKSCPHHPPSPIPDQSAFRKRSARRCSCRRRTASKNSSPAAPAAFTPSCRSFAASAFTSPHASPRVRGPPRRSGRYAGVRGKIVLGCCRGQMLALPLDDGFPRLFFVI